MFIFFLATLLLIARWRHIPGDPGQENSPLEEAQMALEPKLETFWSKQRRKIKVSARTSQLTRKGSVQRSFIDNKIISAEEQSLKLKLIVIFWTWMVRITFFLLSWNLKQLAGPSYLLQCINSIVCHFFDMPPARMKRSWRLKTIAVLITSQIQFSPNNGSWDISKAQERRFQNPRCRWCSCSRCWSTRRQWRFSCVGCCLCQWFFCLCWGWHCQGHLPAVLNFFISLNIDRSLQITT